ncbi:MAG TPA: hypothetical protein VG897_14155 [Terriglobales bacterium]|nr:hypothetical protein [Terriglobales bacterium]
MIENIRKVIIVIGILILTSFYFIPRWMMNQSRSAPPETEVKANDGSAAPSRVASIEKLRYQNPGKGLAMLEEILAKPQNDKEREAANGLLPEFLELNFHKCIRDKSYDDARKMVARLTHDYPDAVRSYSVRYTWGRDLGRQLHEAATANDPTKVESIFIEYHSGGYHLPARNPQNGQIVASDSSVLEEYAKFQLARWKDLPAEARSQETGFALATNAFGCLLDHNQTFQLFRVISTDPLVPGEELQALEKTFADKKLMPQAYNTAMLGAMMLQNGRGWSKTGQQPDYKTRQELQEKFEERTTALAMSVAVQLESDPGSVWTAMTPDLFISTAIGSIQNEHYRLGLMNHRLQIGLNNFIEETEPLTKANLSALGQDRLPYEEKSRLSSQLDSARRQVYRIDMELRRPLFEARLRDTNAAIWPQVSLPVIAEIERAVPVNTPLPRVEELKRQQLRKMVEEGSASIPVETSPRYEERLLQVLAVDGVYSLGNDRERAFRDLRKTLREGNDTKTAALLQQAVQQAIRSARKQDNFEAIIELAGFYSAEFGDNLAGDAFRNEFREVLESSATKFQTGDRTKYVFVEALLATAFANEEVGRKAQLETVKRAFDLVNTVPIERGQSRLHLPSGMSGYSSVAVQNETEYHILVVYDGPESFAALCNPYRKGSMAMKNGIYRIAVLTPMGRITPYHGERQLTDEHGVSRYFITRRDSSGQSYNPNGVSAYGDYVMLRASDALAGAQVDPKTGRFKGRF